MKKGTSTSNSLGVQTRNQRLTSDSTTDDSLTFTREEIQSLIAMATEKAVAEAVRQAVKATTELFNEKLTQLERLSQRCSQQEEEISSLKEELKESKKRHNHLEQYSRRNNIRIRGVQVERGENCKQIVVEFLNQKLKDGTGQSLNIQPCDIDAAHPLPQRRRNTEATPSPMIIVKFLGREPRDAIMRARRSLKGSNYTIMEDLTAPNAELLRKLKDSPAIDSAWSWEGKVFALPRGADSLNGKKKFDILDNIPA